MEGGALTRLGAGTVDGENWDAEVLRAPTEIDARALSRPRRVSKLLNRMSGRRD